MKPAAILLALLFLVSCDEAADTVPGVNRGLTPVAKKKPMLSGYVEDEAGTPIDGVSVRVFTPVAISGKQSISGKSDREGYFELDVEGELGVQERIPLFLDLRKEWFLPAQHQLSAWRPGLPKSVEITMQPAGAVTGRVLDGEKRPVAGALVFCLPPDSPGVENRKSVPRTVTDERGRFRLPELPIRGMDIGVLANGFTQALKGPANVLAKVDVPFGDIVLSPGGRLEGEVRTLAGKPIRGARVHAFREPGLRDFELFGRSSVDRAGATALTDENGRFVITTLRPGAYTVQAAMRGHRFANSSLRDIEPGRTDLELTLEPEVEIELLVFDAASGSPVPAYTVTIIIESMSFNPTSTDQVRSRDGIYKFVVSEGASLSVAIVAEGFEPHRIELTVTEESDRSLRIPLKAR